jgi:hypothetical protein
VNGGRAAAGERSSGYSCDQPLRNREKQTHCDILSRNIEMTIFAADVKNYSSFIETKRRESGSSDIRPPEANASATLSARRSRSVPSVTAVREPPQQVSSTDRGSCSCRNHRAIEESDPVALTG